MHTRTGKAVAYHEQESSQAHSASYASLIHSTIAQVGEDHIP